MAMINDSFITMILHSFPENNPRKPNSVKVGNEEILKKTPILRERTYFLKTRHGYGNPYPYPIIYFDCFL